MKQKRLIIIILMLLIFFIPAGCNTKGDEDIENVDISSDSDPEDDKNDPEPKNIPVSYNAFNPLTGLYDMASDNVGVRPVAVSMTNYRYSRWQSGISAADIIFEAESEQGQTQMICIYADIRKIGVIGPVGNVYDTHVKAILNINPVILHRGYPRDYPDCYLDKNNIPSLSGEADGSLLYVDEERHEEYLLEYSIFTDGTRISNAIKNSFFEASGNWTAFDFASLEQPVTTKDSGVARNVTAIFSGTYDVDLRYDDDKGEYCKYQFLFSHSENDSKNKPLSFGNAFILFAHFDAVTDLNGVNNRLTQADYSGGGKGYYFFEGRYQEISWEKNTATGLFTFYDNDKQILKVNPGKTYIAVLNSLNEFTLNISE